MSAKNREVTLSDIHIRDIFPLRFLVNGVGSFISKLNRDWDEGGGRGGREKSDGLENEYLHRLGGRVIKRAGPSSLMGA